MTMTLSHRPLALVLVVIVLGSMACAAPPAPTSPGGAAPRGEEPARRTKTFTIGIVGNAEGFGLAGSGGPTGGGWASASEVHSNGLITSEPHSRKPIGEVAESVPSLDDGTITFLPDGRVRVVYRLRPDVTWQDGARFSAGDLLFSYQVATDRALPFITQANLLAGAVDMFLDATLRTELEQQLDERWRASGEGTVRAAPGDNGRFLTPQFRPEFQVEPATLDPRVRGALYLAIDRDAFAEALGRPGLAAYGIRPPGDLFYDATKDAFRPYAYDPNRAREQLAALGWVTGSDGLVRSSADGRPYRTAISSTPGADAQVAIIADAWRRIGISAEEQIVSAALARNTEYLSQFPGWELTGNRADALLTRLTAVPAGPANRWSGSNRGGFVDPTAQQLVSGFILSLSPADQLRAMQRIGDYIATELPVLMLVYDAAAVGFRTGIVALDDVQGGGGGGTPYGLYSRNAHLWDRG